MADEREDDGIQHGIDDNPNNDAEKGAVLGGIGGAVTGAVAGALAGPVGAVTGGVIGAVAGAVASGLGVAAVDRIDDDNTMTGLNENPKSEGSTARDRSETSSHVVAQTDQGMRDQDLAWSSTGQQGYVPETEMAGMGSTDLDTDQVTDRDKYGSSGTMDNYDPDYYTGNTYENNRRYYDEASGRAYTGQELSSMNDDQRRTMKLRAERLDVQKRPVQAGEVTLRKDVVTENKTIEVPTTREELVVERHPVSGQEAMSAGDIQEGEEIRVPLMREDVQVTKTPVVTEEVGIGKRQVTENQEVNAQLRHEEARIENPQNVPVENADNLNVDVDQDAYEDSDVNTRRRSGI